MNVSRFQVTKSEDSKTSTGNVMSSKRWVIRVVQTRTPEGQFNYEGHDLGSFVQFLSESGLGQVHHVSPSNLTTLCFDIFPPFVPDEKEWSEKYAELLSS